MSRTCSTFPMFSQRSSHSRMAPPRLRMSEFKLFESEFELEAFNRKKLILLFKHWFDMLKCQFWINKLFKFSFQIIHAWAYIISSTWYWILFSLSNKNRAGLQMHPVTVTSTLAGQRLRLTLSTMSRRNNTWTLGIHNLKWTILTCVWL